MSKKLILMLLLTALLVSCSDKKEKAMDSSVSKTAVEEVNRDKMDTKELKRESVDQKYKWNLNDIYADWAQWESDLEKAKKIMSEIPEYKGKIKYSSDNFTQIVLKEEELSKLIEKLYCYPRMMQDLNTKDLKASEKMQEIEALFTEYSVNTAWITPEILEINKETMDKWIEKHEELKPHKFSINEIYRLQKHVLPEPEEKLLSYFGQFNGSPDDIYQMISIADIKWNEVQLADGTKTPVTNGIYSKILSTDRNQDDRKKAFEGLYSVFNDNKNTYCAIYRAILQKDVANGKARNYNSTLEKALEPINLSENVFQALLKSALDHTEPLKRYARLRKEALGLKEYHYYDNSINIVDYNKEFPYDEATKIVLKAVEPLGDDYIKKVQTAIGAGWLDVYETENKRSGAYSMGIYGVHPYMLLNYQSTMDDVFTLAHEMGHTIHTMLSHENQPYPTADYKIFVAEVASTFNERLLLDYMIANSNDPKEKIALLEQALGNIVGTYYIQTLFANYEYQAHKLVEDGKPITPDTLSNIMDTLFKQYFGDTLTMDELQKIIWARIPHFFNSPYYVYQYATSFASSANIYERVTDKKYSDEERKKATESYLNLLKSGGSDYPMALLKNAGVDLEDPKSFDAVSEEFDRLLDLLEEELKKIK